MPLDIQSKLSTLPGFPWSKYPGEKHLPGHNYVGPGTRLEIRLDGNDKPKPGEEPIDRDDAAAYIHDLKYRDCGENLQCKHEGDRIMLQQLDAIKDPTFREKLDTLLIKGVINTKLKFGVGLSDAEQLADELHKPYKKPRVYLRVKVNDKDHIWTADLVTMPTDNQGRSGTFKYILTVMDCYTRFAWAVPLQNKTGLTTKTALENIMKSSSRTPQKLWVDRGKEFYNSNVKQLLEVKNIDMYSTGNEGKAVMIERLNRTIEEKLWKRFTVQGHQKWIKILPEVVEKYNNTVHSSIKTTPLEASKNPESIRLINYENININELTQRKKKPRFQMGDRVRIFKYKDLFEKGYTASWTNEVFKISEVIQSSPITYRIKDLNEEDIEGRFYENELQKTHF
jgi:transposase InsO family protein